MKNLLKNTICIDLRLFNYKQLESISAKYSIELSYLTENKKAGYAKLFFINSSTVIAYNTKKDSTIIFTEEFLTALSDLKPVTLSRKNLNVDDILDKISKYGRNSLTKNEVLFLESLNK